MTSESYPIARLLTLVEQGTLSRRELVNYLIEKAATVPPEVFIAQLPHDVINDLREASADPPQNRTEFLVIQGITEGPNFDSEAYFCNLRDRVFDGMWQWHDYFKRPDGRV